jgi:hypothetical protein
MKHRFAGSKFPVSRFLFSSALFAGALLTLVAIPVLAIGSIAAAGAVQTVFSQCGCLCVEGVPRTLCSSVEEAQAKPGLCGRTQCPDYVATENGGQRYVSPHAFADNCREVRVWDAETRRYSGIKVCDVLDLPTRN